MSEEVTFAASPSIISPQSAPYYTTEDEINHYDAIVAKCGGTTSAIEREPQRIRYTKKVPTTTARIEELTRENGYLRAEIAHWTDVNMAFQCLRDETIVFSESIQQALQEFSRRLNSAHREAAKNWGYDLDLPFQGQRLKNVI